MCIIAIKPAGKKMMDDTTITTMFINNPDGAGYMFYDKGTKKVVIKKGFMTCHALLSSLHSRDFTDTNVILHFRIGTSGLNDGLNCHPYPIYNKNALKVHTDLAMAHNGILHNFIPPKTSPINDTQYFIGEVLSDLKPNFLSDPDKVMLIKKLIGTNKLAFLDSSNNVTTIGDFIEDGGYIYSNKSYSKWSLYPAKTCYSTAFGKKPEKVATKSVSTPKATAPSVSTCVSTRHKLTSDELDFWRDEPNDFWDDWDRRHPA